MTCKQNGALNLDGQALPVVPGLGSPVTRKETLSNCMFFSNSMKQQTHIKTFDFASKFTSKLTLTTQTSLFLCVFVFRDLSRNQLSGTIPSSIGNLAQLQFLYVHSCIQFHQQTHIKTHSFNPNFSIFV